MNIASKSKGRVVSVWSHMLIVFAVLVSSSVSRAYELRTAADGMLVAYDTDSLSVKIDMTSAPETAADPDAVRSSFYAWTSAGVPVAVEFDVAVQNSVEIGNDGVNVVKWEIETWAFDPAVVATTLTTFDFSSGRVLDTDIVMNAVSYRWTNDSETPEAHDVANVLTHEVGHLFGLGHSSDPESTMFPTAPTNETKKRSLAQDDRDGLVALAVAKEQRVQTELTSSPENTVQLPSNGEAEVSDRRASERIVIGCSAAPSRHVPGWFLVISFLLLVGFCFRKAVPVVIALLWAIPANATVMQELSVAELTARSQVVVQGTVSKKAVVFVGRILHTAYTIDVEACLTGVCEQQTVVMVPGGRVGNIGVLVDGATVLNPGEKVVAFAAGRTNAMRFVGMAQGVFKVKGTWAVRDLTGLQLLDQHFDPDVENAGAVDRRPLADLLRTISQRSESTPPFPSLQTAIRTKSVSAKSLDPTISQTIQFNAIVEGPKLQHLNSPESRTLQSGHDFPN